MNNEPLAPIFLDDKPIALKDPKPLLSAVLSAGGRAEPELKWVQTSSGKPGAPLGRDAVLDRTSQPTRAIYLTSQPAVRGVAPPARPADGPDAAPSALPWPDGPKRAGASEASVDAAPREPGPAATAADAPRRAP